MTEIMDIRVRDRYIKKGRISLSEVTKRVEALPDLSENCDWVDYEKEFAESREDAESAVDGDAPASTGFAAAPPNPGSLV